MSNVFRKHDSNIKIHLSNKLKKEIFLICEKSYPNETGGIIIGRYSSDFNTAIISTCLLQNKSADLCKEFVQSPALFLCIKKDLPATPSPSTV